MIPQEQLRGVPAVTFDCYGTLIDWEPGLLRAARATPGGEAEPDLEVPDLKTLAKMLG